MANFYSKLFEKRLTKSIAKYRAQLKPFKGYLASETKKEIGRKLKGAQQLKKILKTTGGAKAIKGAASIAGLGTIAAGAAVVAAWAYPAKELGKYLGKRSVEKGWKIRPFPYSTKWLKQKEKKRNK